MTEQDNEQSETVNELEQIRVALKNANSESAAHRHTVKELEQQLAALSEATDRFKSQSMNSQISSVLERNGIKNPKVANLFDREKVSLDDDGNLMGADEQIEQIRTEFPELFVTREQKIPNVDAADQLAAKRPLTSAERLLKRNDH
ncbi:phage scaffolding protein [Rhodococcus sp. IEGM 1379]|uniref:phage scaffolding protein n=1 Tax=Rhodococcus sp. IEGM 1379 TaxID=3047086 RepID=UPI0024B650A3|nr:phage scaffolding protein [Rhodococcus sp. IEGM 1379]MDI9916904.1 phage scaffolding protein [Rhodococcus sp. IEGM 1379]